MGIRSWITADGAPGTEEVRGWFWPDSNAAQARILEGWPRQAASATSLAMQVPTAVRCIEILTTQIMQFPAEAWRGDVRLDDQPRLLRRPDPFSSYRRFVYGTVMDMLVCGGAAWLTTSRDDMSRPLTLRRIPASSLEVRWDPSMSPAMAELNMARQFLYDGIQLDPGDVTYVPMITVSGEAAGVGPVQAGVDITAGQVSADQLVRSNFTDGAFPSGTVTVATNLSQAAADDLQRKFMDRAGGSRAPVVMSGGAEFRPHAVTARDSQWIEARQWGAADIARLFGVPAAMLHIPVQGGSQVTYNNAVSVRTDLLHLGLSPINARLEDAFGSLLPTTQDCHLDTTRYLPPLEAITPASADPNSPPADTPATPAVSGPTMTGESVV